MHDLNFIKQNPEKFDSSLQRRKLKPCASEINALNDKRTTLITQKEDLLHKKNVNSQKIAKLKKTPTHDEKNLTQEVQMLSQEIRVNKATLEDLETQLQSVQSSLYDILAYIPNVLDDSVPDGDSENDNKLIKQQGELPKFAFPPNDHDTIGTTLELMDFSTAANMSGARFVILKGDLSLMERALSSFMLDIHTRHHGFSEVSPPALVQQHALFGTGQLPKFSTDIYQTNRDLYLSPTSEVQLANLMFDKIIQSSTLPLRYTAFTPCFRSEAGAAGKDTKGMLRQHQFYKVELFSFTHPDNSFIELEYITSCAEKILELLELPYRRVLLCSADTGFSSVKTYDLEVWMPSQNTFREISSCSNCLDFQARRLNSRIKNKTTKGTSLPHTLNGSGLAIGRTLIAIMENFQNDDLSFSIPQALQPYMHGKQTVQRVDA